MKIVIIGDIHGHNSWKTIIEDNKDSDKFIFLGDYVDSFNISPEEQIKNLNELLDFKEKNSDKVILLRGNHDTSELGYSWAECSGKNRCIEEGISKERFLNLTQWIYIDNFNLKEVKKDEEGNSYEEISEHKIIFSHAGVTNLWLKNTNLTLDKINDELPSDIFGFWPDDSIAGMYDCYGTSKTQGPLWIRPSTLVKDNVSGYDQVIGHTHTKSITNCKQSAKEKRNIWLCDTLDVHEYLTIEDYNVKVCKFK